MELGDDGDIPISERSISGELCTTNLSEASHKHKHTIPL